MAHGCACLALHALHASWVLAGLVRVTRALQEMVGRAHKSQQTLGIAPPSCARCSCKSCLAKRRHLAAPSRLPAAEPAEPRRIKIPVVIMQPDAGVDVGYILRVQQAQQGKDGSCPGCHELDAVDQQFRWGSLLAIGGPCSFDVDN